MDPIEVSSVTVSPGRPAKQEQHGEGTVVWLRGEHDATTAVVVAAALREAVNVDGGDVVVDLSGVQFMGAEIVGVVVQAEQVLRAHSRALRLRRPTRCALRIVELCDLERMLDDAPDVARATGPAGALGTWVTVPHSNPVVEPAGRAGGDSKPLSVAPSVWPLLGQQLDRVHEPMTNVLSAAPRKGV